MEKLTTFPTLVTEIVNRKCIKRVTKKKTQKNGDATSSPVLPTIHSISVLNTYGNF